MTTPPVAVADTVLADRYRLVERIAVGGMGEVWRADDLLLRRPVAVKTLKPEFVDDEDFRARFRAEARHAARLGHPGIASVYDFGEAPGRAWLVMELVDGEPLSSLLRREGTLSVDRTLDLVAQTAAALQAAHDGGVVHRDVKPGNLLVRPDGVLKVTDFGIASATDAVPLTGTGLVIGTAYYLSPEQARGRSGSPASDTYGLGVVAYECLTGSRPFPGDNPVAVALAHVQDPVPPLPSEVPAPVRALVQRALAKDPQDRFATVSEMGRTAQTLRATAPGSDGEQRGLAALPVDPPSATRTGPDATGVLDLSHETPHALARPPRRLPGSRARSSRSTVRLAAALLAVLAVGVSLRAALSATDVAPVPTVTSAASPPAVAEPIAAVVQPPRVTVDAARYLGRPAVEVRDAIAALGLVPRLSYDGTGQPVGTVSSVQPAGALAVGSGVVLQVVPVPAPSQAAPPATPAPPASETGGKSKGSGGKGKGRGKK